MRTYKGWTIERVAHNGYWRGSSIVNGYYMELKADTLLGLKQLITGTLKGN